MLREDSNIMCLDRKSPGVICDSYFRQLVLVASHGDDWARRLFVRTNGRVLGGYTGYMLHLSAEHLRVAFSDALVAQRGSWPETLMGYRLAVPVRLPYRRSDAWAFWEGLVDYRPTGLAVDPVCDMFVDPDTAPYLMRDGARMVYFCCPRCLAGYVPADPDAAQVRRLHFNQDQELPTSA
ncbi:MAG: hypothetical protein KKA32_02080 [Actinobacteria bacterium]|nr:hypothetical protein [Actinomycetota bacterium]